MRSGSRRLVPGAGAERSRCRDIPSSRPGIRPGERHAVAVGPLEQIVFKATGSTTGDAFEFFEMTVQPGGGPPDHTHRDHDEAYYLCAGSLRFRLGDQLFTATAGTYLFVPEEKRTASPTHVPRRRPCWCS
jgi:mannose-6-phosphate isomerase-like protein (cupin superfamily)